MALSYECSKTVFRNESAANEYIEILRKTSTRSRVPKRAYLCPVCLKWHLTSGDKEDMWRQKYRDEIRKLGIAINERDNALRRLKDRVSRESTFEEINSDLFKMLPADQKKRVFNSDMGDIDGEFLGFVNFYHHLSRIIPKEWIVIDLGCAYAPQSFYFEGHVEYVGVDLLVKERFCGVNSVFYEMSIEQFISKHLHEYDLDKTFAICSYVPPWGGDNAKMVRDAFKNCFVFYP